MIPKQHSISHSIQKIGSIYCRTDHPNECLNFFEKHRSRLLSWTEILSVDSKLTQILKCYCILYPCYFKMLCQAQARISEQDASWGNGYSLIDWCNQALIFELTPRRARQLTTICFVIKFHCRTLDFNFMPRILTQFVLLTLHLEVPWVYNFRFSIEPLNKCHETSIFSKITL
jgi:hypothetical protein